jgi:hypothetical protein
MQQFRNFGGGEALELAKDGSWGQGRPALNWDPTAGLADNTSASFYNESMASSGEEFYRFNPAARGPQAD